MDFLIRKKFLVSLIIILVFLNISSLVMVWILSSEKMQPMPQYKQERARGDAMDFIQSELALDSLQEIKIAELRDKHFIDRRTADKFILDWRREIIKETIKPNPDTLLMKKYAAEIGAKQQELELFIYDHFEGIKSVLRPEQVEIFDELMHELIEKNPPPPTPNDRRLKPPPPRKDRGDKPPTRPKSS